MFPNHCREVSVKRVAFPLTEVEIRKNLLTKPAYKRTKFMILNNEESWAVTKIKKSHEDQLFSNIDEVEIISLPDSTAYIEDPNIDVLSPTRMAEKAKELNALTLIVKGKFEHVSFIHDEELRPLVVFDVIPPKPPKLVEMVRAVLNSGILSKPVKIIPQIMDLCEAERDYKTQNVVFPCHASGLTSDKETFYLDERPDFTGDELKSITLIGCDLSLRIFKTLYGKDPEFYNFCPKKRALEMQPEQFVITKCCELKEGYECMGNIVVVPWGSTQREVEDALNELFNEVI
jgi:hypothetical protein